MPPKKNIDDEYVEFEYILNYQQKNVFDELKKKLNKYVEKCVGDTKSKYEDEVYNLKVGVL